jgi:hypothetical protein
MTSTSTVNSAPTASISQPSTVPKAGGYVTGMMLVALVVSLGWNDSALAMPLTDLKRLTIGSAVVISSNADGGPASDSRPTPVRAKVELALCESWRGAVDSTILVGK